MEGNSSFGKKKGQIGRVISFLDNNILKVKIQRHSSCKNCGVCNLGMLGTNEKIVNVENTVDAKTGDFVMLEVKDGAVLSASFILYIIPLLAFLGGLIGGNIWGRELGMEPDVLSVILGGTLLVVAFVSIRVYDRMIRGKNNKFNPYITRIASLEEAKEMIGEEEFEEEVGEGSQ